jgi:predicted nuclease of restriction endonuclease-like RecB superfamily
MLTKDLLRYRIDAGQIQPAFLNPDSPRYVQAARELVVIFGNHLNATKAELEEALEKYASSRTDYRILRGVAKVLMSFAEFDEPKPDAAKLRSTVFERAANAWPVVRRKSSPLDNDRRDILEDVTGETGLPAANLEAALYADLPERRRMICWSDPRDPEAVIARYNMELARGLLYWAERLTIDIEDSYQDVFRYIKLCRLMHTITRRERGYRIELDGPLSLLRGTLRYGLKMAIFLPALALCRTWRMDAVVVKGGERLIFTLDDQSRLVSHFRRFPNFDSQLEQNFATDFQKAFERHSHNWQLTRADAVISLARNEVMIPDFTLRNSTAAGGREIHLEIVGFWTPEYLSKKIAKATAAAATGNLILAVSKQLALGEEAAKELNVLWFSKKLPADAVIARADSLVEYA